jgi:hypothetical protein
MGNGILGNPPVFLGDEEAWMRVPGHENVGKPKPKKKDTRNWQQKSRDYLNETGRKYLGPHGDRAFGLLGMASEFSDAADIRDAMDYSKKTVDAVRQGDWWGAAGAAPWMLAATGAAMMPGVSMGMADEAAEGVKKSYQYAMRYRPPANATVPPGFREFGPQTAEYKFGTVVYDKPLSSKVLEEYEMVPLDPRHPLNLKRSFDEFSQQFMAKFADDGETFQSPSGDYIVTPSITGDGWQMTRFTLDGEAAGHEVFTDFDDLSRFVWANERKRE